MAAFDKSDDVLNHHDGVVHHEAGRNRQRHERKVVEAEAGEFHHTERGDQRERQRYAGNDRGPKLSQEDEDDHHDERDGEQQRELHVGHRCTDGFGAVAEDSELHGGGQCGAQLRQQRFHLVGGLDDVRTRLALDVEQHGWLAAHPACHADILHVVHRFTNVRHANGRTVSVGDDDVAIIGGGKNLVVRVDGVGLARAIEAAFGRVDTAGDERRAHIFQA